MPGISRTPTLSQIQSFTQKPALIGPRSESQESIQTAQQLLKVQESISQDGQIQQNEIKTLDSIQLSVAAQQTDLGQILGHQITDFKQVAQFAADTQQGIDAKNFASPQAFRKKFTEITGKIDTARAKIEAFNRLAQASERKGLSPQESKLLSLQLKLAQKELRVLNQLLNKFVGDFEKLSPTQVARKLEERGLDIKSPEVRSALLQAKGVAPEIIAKINATPNAANNVALNSALLTLNAQGVQRLNSNPEVLSAFANILEQTQEGFSAFGKGSPEKLLNDLSQEFATFLETGNAQGLYFAASARPSSPEIGRVLLEKSGIGPLAKKIALEEQIKPFQDSAALLKAGDKNFDFGTVNGKKVSLSGQDLNGENFLKSIASTAAQIGIEPEDFARFIRFQLLKNPNQKDFVFDTPEKLQAFRDDVNKFTQQPPAFRDQILSDASNLLNNLKELGEAPLKFVNVNPDEAHNAGLARHDANPAKIKESLNKIFDENEPLKERAAAFGDLLKVYKGFQERFEAGGLTKKDSKEFKLFQDLRSQLEGVFFNKDGKPRDYGKQIDALAGILGGAANVNAIIQNFRVLAQGDTPFKFEAIPGSNSVKITQGAADILNPGDKVKINGKEYTVDSVDGSQNTVSFKEPLSLKQGEFKLELSFLDKALKGIEIVTKASDIAETIYKAKESYDAAKSFFKKAQDPAKQLAEIEGLRKVALENSQKLYKSTVNAVDKIKASIKAAVQDPKLAERISKTIDHLKDALHALSPKASKSFFEALSKSPSLLKRFVDFAQTVDKKIGLDRLNKGLKYAYKTLRGTKAEDIAKATSAAEKGGVGVAQRAQAKIPILGTLANAGVTALDLKTFVDDYNAGKDNFVNFNNFVAIVSDVAAFAPGLGQSISLALDAYGAGIAVGTLINEKGGIKQAYLEGVNKELGYDQASLGNDTRYAILRNQGIIGNGEELVRNAKDGSGKAIIASQGKERFRELTLDNIQADVKSGAISQTEAFLLYRNIGFNAAGQKDPTGGASDQEVIQQIQDDLNNNKITKTEALLFLRAVLDNRRDAAVEGQLPVLYPPSQPIVIETDTEKAPAAAQRPAPTATDNAPRPTISVVAPGEPDPFPAATGSFGPPPISDPTQGITLNPPLDNSANNELTLPPAPPQAPPQTPSPNSTKTEDEPQITLIQPPKTPAEVEKAKQEAAALQIKLQKENVSETQSFQTKNQKGQSVDSKVITNIRVPPNTLEIEASLNTLKAQAQKETNPIKKAFLQQRIAKIEFYLSRQGGIPGTRELNTQLFQ